MSEVEPVQPDSFPYEQPILEKLAELELGASHDLDHLIAALKFAKQLGDTYGADRDILVATVLLHDLGRSDPTLHGTASAEASARLAPALLQAVGFPEAKVAAVLQNILDHDQPALVPRRLEGRILKDADFLGGFGATGIARAAMWTGESGGTLTDFITRVDTKMTARIQSLEFPESRAYARQQYAFARLFLDELLHTDTKLPRRTAKYIVLDGISGSGKSTQARRLGEHLGRLGRQVLAISEPGQTYGRLKASLEATQLDSTTQALLLMASRHIETSPEIEQALAEGTDVIADRSYLSTLVYQGEAMGLSPAKLAYLHNLIVQPTQTHMIILDIPAEAAYQRISQRTRATGQPLGNHETMESLNRHRSRFLNLSRLFPDLIVLNVDGLNENTVHQKIKQLLGL